MDVCVCARDTHARTLYTQQTFCGSTQRCALMVPLFKEGLYKNGFKIATYFAPTRSFTDTPIYTVRERDKCTPSQIVF
jgi:hypothetical protein